MTDKTSVQEGAAAIGDLGQRLQSAFKAMLISLVKKVPDVVAALVLFAIFFAIALIMRRVVRAALRRAHIHQNVVVLISRLVYYAVLTIGFVEALGQTGINLTALAAGIGVAGFALGFALKDILSNFLSGILILWTRHFSVGDQIRIQDFEGTVEAIELRGTILRTYDGRRVTIPNSTVYTNAVVNNTAYTQRRSSIFLTVGYDVDLEKTEDLIRSALKAVPQVLEEPRPDVLVKELGDYSVQLEIRIWTPATQLELLTVNSQAVRAVKDSLESSGIVVATPMQIVVESQSKPE